MKIVCPYCKQEMTGEVALPPLRPRWQRIYDALLQAGPQGMKPEDLQVRMYAEDEFPTPGGATVLRVSICDMNKKLRGFRQQIINWHRGCYRLVSTKEQESEEIKAKAQQETDH